MHALCSLEAPPDTQANRVWFGQYAVASVLVAHRLGLFDRCERVEWTALPELARRLEVHEEALFRVARVLACRELLEVERNRVRLTAQSRTYWRRDGLLYRGAQLEEVRPEGEAPVIPYHQARILKMLRDGWDPARTRAASFSEMWEAGAVDPAAAESYNAFMRTQSFSVAIHAARSGAYDGVERFVDLGGGSAAFALVVKAHHPDAECTILDLPGICDAARTFLESYPELPIALAPGSFFADTWPVRADCFGLSNILHDWTPDRCATLLKRAFDHLAPGGRVVIAEMLLDDDGRGPEPAVVFDMLMYMNHRAQQLSFRELSALTSAAGFESLDRVTMAGDYAILVAKKARRSVRQ